MISMGKTSTWALARPACTDRKFDKGRILSVCWSTGILFSCENPGHSFFWTTSHWQKHSLCMSSHDTTFQICMWALCARGSRAFGIQVLLSLSWGSFVVVSLTAMCMNREETLEQRLARLRARKKALKEESRATQKALKVAKQKKQRLDSLQHGVVGFALKVQGCCGV